MCADTSLKNLPASAGDEFEPAYLKLHETGELKKRAAILWSMMEDCRLCPRECGVDRLQGERGFCRAPGARLVVSSYGPHFGEERPLVGAGGSGTIFFSHCGLRCVFCQNWEISIAGQGIEQSVEDLAEMMLDLQASGCHNINIVTPTHYSAHILNALDHAAARGLRLPLVYNTSGWERLEILALLDGIVDIYMPDFKYCTADMASKYSSGAGNYPDLTAGAILEMYRQVGASRYAKGGIMQRGIIIRHLVLPNAVSGSEKIMEWIAMNLPKDTFVNIMAQYHPDYKAYDIPELSRKVTAREYKAVVERAKHRGLVNLDIQGSWLL
ncbi:MAG: radical SAM protein [Desulfomicrobium sp.]|nr:radical SAM protein [Desulfomicrobium sp.]